MAEKKVGVLACSGEECLGGTLSRLATRMMMEKLRPERTVTLCLPLFIAGGEEERNFAKEYPVIAVEGCSKHCSTCATEKFSGKVHDVVDIAELFGEDTALLKIVSTRDLNAAHQEMIRIVAEKICARMDAIQ
ncbi:MAG: putative zinc-binding protein [Treponema sp.]|nr:putative zinc-binding protein [Treponema sp.]